MWYDVIYGMVCIVPHHTTSHHTIPLDGMTHTTDHIIPHHVTL